MVSVEFWDFDIGRERAWVFVFFFLDFVEFLFEDVEIVGENFVKSADAWEFAEAGDAAAEELVECLWLGKFKQSGD